MHPFSQIPQRPFSGRALYCQRLYECLRLSDIATENVSILWMQSVQSCNPCVRHDVEVEVASLGPYRRARERWCGLVQNGANSCGKEPSSL